MSIASNACKWVHKRYRDHVTTASGLRSDASGLDAFAAAIDRDAEVPVGLQLSWALCARIYDGEFGPGQRLPGLRELAEASRLNVNTVRAVYQRLEQQGLIESRQGSGTFVAADLPRPSAVGTIAADAAREAAAIGVSPREVAAALYVAVSEGRAEDEHGLSRRRMLRAQIATLERAISEIEAEHPGAAPRSGATRRGPGPTLLSAEELEQVRSGLVRRLAAVQTAIDERAAASAALAKEQARQKASARAHTSTTQDSARSTPSPAPSLSASKSTGKRSSKPRPTPRPSPAGT